MNATPAAAWESLLVLGDVVTDVVARHRQPLAPGTDTVATIRTVPGGAGANVACWAARWGAHGVRLLASAGADSADWHEQALREAGVRPHLVVVPTEPTGTVICLVDESAAAERTFLTATGASLALTPDHWSAHGLDGVAHLHISGYLFFSEPSRSTAAAALAEARERGVPVSVDPASSGFLAEQGVERFLTTTRGAGILLPNLDEARLLTGLPDPVDAAAKLSRQFPLVVVTLGADGALVARGGSVSRRVPAPAVTPVDTTGAGDAFTGAFLTALLAGADPEHAAEEGCRAGAEAVVGVGGRPGRERNEGFGEGRLPQRRR
ncbi:sugar kinase [Streptomyces sp. NA04227]|uniref:carbohydrate kinase family protein n=1 Tax=Streptomyces sp. NA04227 TaxID=2742136 RepID=UPI00159019F9|nr:sugar kinase [Streptomyces sp. NA04227]QKW05873.1 sugar kinase [Streptomyces sp. NA04227]